MKRPQRKLEFRKEIVKLLEPGELARAAGGLTTWFSCTCPQTEYCTQGTTCL